tara:strand:- start:2929 stop:3402 length:474 start_codon:yes stop_codon:yes gene_type:complete
MKAIVLIFFCTFLLACQSVKADQCISLSSIGVKVNVSFEPSDDYFLVNVLVDTVLKQGLVPINIQAVYRSDERLVLGANLYSRFLDHGQAASGASVYVGRSFIDGFALSIELERESELDASSDRLLEIFLPEEIFDDQELAYSFDPCLRLGSANLLE